MESRPAYPSLAAARHSGQQSSFFVQLACALLSAWLLATPAVHAQTTLNIDNANLQKRANGVLALMGYMLTPDVTTGSLSISDGTTENPGLAMTSLGGGFTMSRDFPLYLEGTAAYARYDPTFVASSGTDERLFPAKWNSVSGTAGVGWDLRIAEEWVLRPMLNFSLGHVESDLAIATDVAERRLNREIDFLDNGQLNAVGLGGSLMLDYEHYRPEGEVDLELRYTNIHLESFGNTSDAVRGHADAQSAAAWARWRAPTGFVVLERPLRYVLELAHTQFLDDLRGVLGFDYLTSVGTGLELDSSKYDIIVTRTRLLLRYKFGDNVEGWSVGLAVSF